MARLPWSDARDDERTTPERKPASNGAALPVDRLTIGQTRDRELVQHRGRTYRLDHADVKTLVTLGTFRVVRADDLQPMASSRGAWTGQLRHLRDQGLIDVKTVMVNRQPVAVAVLTREGKSLLEAHQDRSTGRPAQVFHAGLVKPRELAHDAQLCRLFHAEAARIKAEGGRIQRVVLDYELKREYQKFLNRPTRAHDGEDVSTFAARHHLSVVDGHVELPDLRIEYETFDSSLAHRDVELVTEHYSRAQLAGKSAAGFSMYRAAGARRSGGAARTGGTPVDPHHLEWLG